MTTSRDNPLARRLAIAVVVLVAGVTAIGTQPAGAVTNCSPSPSWGANRADLASQVVALINQYRAGIGLSQLALSASLTASSEWKSLHMAGYGYFDHTDPSPPVSRTAYQRVQDCGYGGSWWGENIAWGYASAQAVVDGWLGSSGHRTNIENPNFSSTGVGVAATSSGRLYWTQSFGNDVSVVAPPAPKPPPAPTPPPTTAAPPAPPPVAAPPAGSTPPGSTASGAATAGSAFPTPAAPTNAGDRPSPLGALPARVIQQRKLSRLTASVAFVETATGRHVAKGSVRCRAEVEGKRLRVVVNVFKARAAHCAWRVPDWARGKQVIGVVAMQTGGAATKRVFIRTFERG